MYFFDLQIFADYLEARGELHRIKQQVDPFLEVAGIVNRACKGSATNKALLFEKVKGSSLPLIANTFGSVSRTAAALGVEHLDTLVAKLKKDLEQTGITDSGCALETLTRTAGIHEQINEDRLQSYVTGEKGLHDLPVLHSWPNDGGRYITLGQVFTQDPDSKVQNCGIYRLHVVDEQTALVRFHPGSGGGVHLQAWHALGADMPIAIALGGPPALTWCAAMSLPAAVTETAFIQYLTGRAVELARCRHSNMLVPASAEIVIEGLVSPGHTGEEGPFGNHTGYYSEIAPAPVVKIQCVSRKENALYPCTVVGPPPMENVYLAQANERILLALLRHDYPWVVDVHMPLEGIYHRAALVAIDSHNGSAEDISRHLRQSRLLKNARLIVLLDRDCPVHDYRDVYWRVINADLWEGVAGLQGRTIDARSSKTRTRLIC